MTAKIRISHSFTYFFLHFKCKLLRYKNKKETVKNFRLYQLIEPTLLTIGGNKNNNGAKYIYIYQNVFLTSMFLIDNSIA